jgi:hypothetical protein
MIIATFNLVLQNFSVPTSVTEVKKPRAALITPDWPVPALERRTFHLYEVPACELKKMCEEFEREVFKRAGKESYLLSGEKHYPTAKAK